MDGSAEEAEKRRRRRKKKQLHEASSSLERTHTPSRSALKKIESEPLSEANGQNSEPLQDFPPKLTSFASHDEVITIPSRSDLKAAQGDAKDGSTSDAAEKSGATFTMPPLKPRGFAAPFLKTWAFVKLFMFSMDEFREYMAPKVETARARSRVAYLLLRMMLFLDSVFRGVAQVVFADNPISGMIIAGAMIGVNPWTGICALFGTLSSTFMGELLQLNYSKIRQGLFGYNGYLVGAGISVFIKSPWNWLLVILIVLFGGFSTILAVAFTNILAPYDLPCFTLPFASLLSLLFLGTRTYTSFDIVDSLTTPRLPLDVRSDLIIEFDIIWRGVINGIAQIYFMESIVGGLLVCLAELIASWKVFVFSVIGSALGVLVGYLLGVPTAEIRSGLWGFNPSLSAMALFPVFMTSNWQSALLSIHSAIATIFVYGGFVTIAGVFGVPGATYAFCLTSIMHLAIKRSVPGLGDAQDKNAKKPVETKTASSASEASARTTRPRRIISKWKVGDKL